MSFLMLYQWNMPSQQIHDFITFGLKVQQYSQNAGSAESPTPSMENMWGKYSLDRNSSFYLMPHMKFSLYKGSRETPVTQRRGNLSNARLEIKVTP